MNAPIGVFDSGVGGLTVLRALIATLPAEDFLYLGDTARLPYGTKSAETVARYSVRAAEALVSRGIKALVVACNTASATALPALRERFPALPVIGVIEPGAQAACEASASGRIAVLATEGTVKGGAYQRAILALRPGAHVTQVAAQVFVALAEEGWSEGEAVNAVAERYLAHLDARVDTVVLGCTHFPLLFGAIAKQLGPARRVVDSAATTARATLAALAARSLGSGGTRAGNVRLMATDSPERFARVGARFLGSSIAEKSVEAIDL
ncbi:MAG TPA: glutamate racemase [Steroidobacteraceae bacterium]|jgi:glutamate racemase|nr:glutamate racemase [Steroidobacteraceae bacterium]